MGMNRTFKAAAIGLVLVIGLASLWLAAGKPLADFAAAVAAHEKGDFATALRLWRPLAERGYDGAQYNLGLMYAGGQGVPQDYAAAVSWYRKAAEQGYPGAQNNLGQMYAHGDGVPQDYAAAVSWYRKDAEQGIAKAQYNLGVFRRTTRPR
jgi:uncharacterized protein